MSKLIVSWNWHQHFWPILSFAWLYKDTKSGQTFVMKDFWLNYILPSGGLLDVATTTTPWLNKDVNKVFIIIESAMSVTCETKITSEFVNIQYILKYNSCTSLNNYYKASTKLGYLNVMVSVVYLWLFFV